MTMVLIADGLAINNCIASGLERSAKVKHAVQRALILCLRLNNSVPMPSAYLRRRGGTQKPVM